LSHQPTAAPYNLNEPSNYQYAVNKAKRAKRFAEKEATQEPENRLLTRDDLDVRARKVYTLKWLGMMESIMRR
jgi:hypothetical protein